MISSKKMREILKIKKSGIHDVLRKIRMGKFQPEMLPDGSIYVVGDGAGVLNFLPIAYCNPSLRVALPKGIKDINKNIKLLEAEYGYGGGATERNAGLMLIYYLLANGIGKPWYEDKCETDKMLVYLNKAKLECAPLYHYYDNLIAMYILFLEEKYIKDEDIEREYHSCMNDLERLAAEGNLHAKRFWNYCNNA